MQATAFSNFHPTKLWLEPAEVESGDLGQAVEPLLPWNGRFRRENWGLLGSDRWCVLTDTRYSPL